jgi:DNA polymerase V
MYDYSSLPRHNVLCIDMQSFYASVECIMRGLDPTTAKLCVVGDANRNGSVVLASSPTMKKNYKIKTGSRLYEVKRIGDPDIVIAQSRMGLYINFSKLINEIFRQFVPDEAIWTYSVDESFLTLDGTEKLWGTPYEAAKKIRSEIFHYTGLISTCGIGENIFLSKFALDTLGKKKGIGEIRYETAQEIIHPTKIGEMWGIGTQMEKHLNGLGINTIGDLAHYPLHILKKKFGVNGEKLHMYAWGIDPSPVIYKEGSPQSVFGFNHADEVDPVKSVGRSIVLLSDYIEEEPTLQVIRELTEEVCEVLRKSAKAGKTVHLSVEYSKNCQAKGFSRQLTDPISTNDVVDIFNMCKVIYYKHHIKDMPVRRLRVAISKLTQENHCLLNPEKEKRKKIADASDSLNNKYGKGTVRTASTLKNTSIMKERVKKVNGHYE